MRNESHRTGGRDDFPVLKRTRIWAESCWQQEGEPRKVASGQGGFLTLEKPSLGGERPTSVLGKFRSKRRVEQRNIHIIPECLGTKICGHSSFLCREPGCTGTPIPRVYTMFSFPDRVDLGRLLALGLSFLICKMETIILPTA